MLIEARLALGEHATLVPDLEDPVAEHPLREGLWAQLMLALYRSDRQAMRCAPSGAASPLARELGIEPSKELTRLEDAILLQEPELDWKASGRERAPGGCAAERGGDVPAHRHRRLDRDVGAGSKDDGDTVARHDELMTAAVTV